MASTRTDFLESTAPDVWQAPSECAVPPVATGPKVPAAEDAQAQVARPRDRRNDAPAAVAEGADRADRAVYPIRVAPASPRLDDPLVRVREVCADLGISRTTLWRWIRGGNFPKPIELHSRRICWHLSEIRRYKEALPRRSYGSGPEAA